MVVAVDEGDGDCFVGIAFAQGLEVAGCGCGGVGGRRVAGGILVGVVVVVGRRRGKGRTSQCMLGLCRAMGWAGGCL